MQPLSYKLSEYSYMRKLKEIWQENRAESPYFQSSGMNALLAAVLTTYGIIINNHTTY